MCGTPFAALMRMDERPPDVDPSTALAVRRSIFPGLGHRKVGRPVEGLARGVLFAILAGMAVLVALAGASSGMLSAVLAPLRDPGPRGVSRVRLRGLPAGAGSGAARERRAP